MRSRQLLAEACLRRKVGGEAVKITLPYPPSANRYWRVFRGRAVKSPEARSYQQRARLLALSMGARPLAGPVSVGFAVFRPRRVGDLDNVLKVILDALNGVAWVDDSQVEVLTAMRFEDKANPRVEVKVEAA
jgi:Holliday junction resolvase RusA-like endonuclease